MKPAASLGFKASTLRAVYLGPPVTLAAESISTDGSACMLFGKYALITIGVNVRN